MRGALFNSNQSRTWNDTGIFELGFDQDYLGYNHSAGYGFDTLSLGFSNVEDGPELSSQLIAGFATTDFFLGSFGLSNQPTNLTDFTDPHPSFLTSLYSKNLIPSLSWGYTAGAHYG